MSAPGQSILETRRYQMFPVLEPSEIERVRRFGVVRSYAAGKPLAKVGEGGEGLVIILAGKVDITQHDQLGRWTPIVTHGPGAFMGEVLLSIVSFWSLMTALRAELAPMVRAI